jgi:hypothetical protein
MNGLVAVRADVAGRVRARLDLTISVPVVLDVRDAHPPVVLVGVPTIAYVDGRVTVPVSVIAPGPGHADALDWLQSVLEVITAAGPLGPYRFLTADPVFVDLGDRSFPAYQLACSIPAPTTFCGNRLQPTTTGGPP